MQSSLGTRVNRRHPDARGLIFAALVNQQGVEAGVKDRSSGANRLGNGLGLNYTGTKPTFGVIPGGWGAIAPGGVNFVTSASAEQPAANAITIMCRYKCASAAANQTLVASSGVHLGQSIDGHLRLFMLGAAKATDANLPVSVVGQTYSIGLRYRSNAATIDFFRDGVQDAGIAATATAFSSKVTLIFGDNVEGFVATAGAVVRDIRVWDRLMPDAAFERYHTNPSSFYLPSRGLRLALRTLSGNFGTFLPFMHPSFTS